MTQLPAPKPPRPGDPMQASVFAGAGRVELQTVPVPEYGPHEALVQMRACGLCGSDALDWYMSPRAPFVFGHEPAGVIAAVGQKVQSFRPGDRVFVHHHAPCGTCSACRRDDVVHCATWRRTNLTPGGLAEYFRVPAENLAHDTLRLPDTVSFVEGALVEPVACAIKALARGQVGAGTSVLVIGLGFMGQAMGHLCRRRHGGLLIGTDLVPARLALAAAWADHVVAVPAGPVPASPAADPHKAAAMVVQQVRQLTGGHGVDVAVVIPAGEQALRIGIAAARSGGTVVLFSPTAPDIDVALPLNDMFFREITLVPSYSAGPADTRRALAAIAAGWVPAADLVSHQVSLAQVAVAYRLLTDPNHSALKVVVTAAP